MVYVCRNIFEHNGITPSHGSGTFILILRDGTLVIVLVERERIVPCRKEKRTIYTEKRNLHRLPQVCRGVLISVVSKGEKLLL